MLITYLPMVFEVVDKLFSWTILYEVLIFVAQSSLLPFKVDEWRLTCEALLPIISSLEDLPYQFHIVPASQVVLTTISLSSKYLKILILTYNSLKMLLDLLDLLDLLEFFLLLILELNLMSYQHDCIGHQVLVILLLRTVGGIKISNLWSNMFRTANIQATTVA